VLAAGWTAEPGDLVPLISPRLRPTEVTERPELGRITDAIRAYHAGDVHAVDDTPVNQRSGEFIQHAWKVLRTVPAGHPVTYTKFAELAGRPAAVRAAASACARNPAALFVPCHRVLRSDGGLGGFRWGTAAKQWLLNLEAQA
jgi:methylated-DNA-[protein]-cysteine S-methyltransferase